PVATTPPPARRSTALRVERGGVPIVTAAQPRASEGDVTDAGDGVLFESPRAPGDEDGSEPVELGPTGRPLREIPEPGPPPRGGTGRKRTRMTSRPDSC